MKIGYIRVSTVLQNEARQVETMQKEGIEDRFIFTDKASGKNFDREGYKAMKNCLRKGDVLYIDSLDRLGRNYDMIKDEWKDITRNIGADIICIDRRDVFNSIKFREMGDIGKVMEDMMLSMMSYVAEQELKKNHERQRQGIAIAKAEGKYKGRKAYTPNDRFFFIANQWAKGDKKLSDAVAQIGVSQTTFFKYCKEYGIKRVDK